MVITCLICLSNISHIPKHRLEANVHIIAHSCLSKMCILMSLYVYIIQFSNCYPLVIQHSYWTLPSIVGLPLKQLIKMVSFHSYVSLPEGIFSSPPLPPGPTSFNKQRCHATGASQDPPGATGRCRPSAWLPGASSRSPAPRCSPRSDGSTMVNGKMGQLESWEFRLNKKEMVNRMNYG